MGLWHDKEKWIGRGIDFFLKHQSFLFLLLFVVVRICLILIKVCGRMSYYIKWKIQLFSLQQRDESVCFCPVFRTLKMSPLKTKNIFSQTLYFWGKTYWEEKDSESCPHPSLTFRPFYNIKSKGGHKYIYILPSLSTVSLCERKNFIATKRFTCFSVKPGKYKYLWENRMVKDISGSEEEINFLKL